MLFMPHDRFLLKVHFIGCLSVKGLMGSFLVIKSHHALFDALACFTDSAVVPTFSAGHGVLLCGFKLEKS